MSSVRLPQDQQRRMETEVRRVLDEQDGAKAIVVATVDGFDLISATQPGQDARHFAAMASSIAAIGSAVSAEANLQRAHKVIIEAEGGFAVINSVRRNDFNLLVCVIADQRANLAQINYVTAQLARQLADQ